jgi:hypothetical protein
LRMDLERADVHHPKRLPRCRFRAAPNRASDLPILSG